MFTDHLSVTFLLLLEHSLVDTPEPQGRNARFVRGEAHLDEFLFAEAESAQRGAKVAKLHTPFAPGAQINCNEISGVESETLEVGRRPYKYFEYVGGRDDQGQACCLNVTFAPP